MIWDLIIIQMNFKILKIHNQMVFKILILEIIKTIFKTLHFHHQMDNKLIHNYCKCYSKTFLQIILIL